jgi:hypothetical protein
VRTLVEIISGNVKKSPKDFLPLKISLTTTIDHLSPRMSNTLTKGQLDLSFLIIKSFFKFIKL